MKSRIKTAAESALTREDVEVLLSEIRLLKISEQRIHADRNRLVAELDENCRPHLDKLGKELKTLTGAVQQWALNNPAEFGKRKSIEFTHGTIGFRTGTPKLALLSRAWTWAKCLEAVQSLLPAFIRNKPEIDKDAILGQREEELIQYAIKACGMKVTQEESFFVEPKLEQPEAREVGERRAESGERKEAA